MRKAVLVVFLSPLLILLGMLNSPLMRVVLPDSVAPTALYATATGKVVDAKGPVAGALVQVKGTPNTVTSNWDGSFSLQNVDTIQPVVITAWVKGYYVGWVSLDPKAADYKGVQDITITLKPLYQTDNFKYPGFTFEGVSTSKSCGLCHREYDEWKADAHSQAAENPRFNTIYAGTDVKGNRGQLTVWSAGVMLPHDPAKPYYGPGFRLDNPQRAGNCATCHTPLAGKIANRQNCGWSGCHLDVTAENSKGIVDQAPLPMHLTGEAADGISCDFCHKVGEVILDPKTNLPYADMPGILSMRLYRPEEGQQLFFGTVKDMNRRVTYSELETKSEFCAPCHYGVFGGVVGNKQVTGGTLIYNSYGEWLASPYSDPKTGKTCQDCHMQVLDTQISVFPEKGGILRDYVDFHNHTMPGASDEKLLQNSVSMKNTAQRVGDQLQVQVSITNDQTGHSIPTDAPTREMILVVEALDASGKPLALSQGSVLPKWSGDLAGQPGKSFAKILRDEYTGEFPTAAYWRPVTIMQDTRLAAMATDTTKYTFSLPTGQAAQVNVRLVFRRSFYDLAKLKGWNDPDILMEQEIIQVEK